MLINVTKDLLEGDLLPDGIYVCRVEKVEFTQSSQKGTPGVSVHLRVLSPEEHAGRMIFDRLYLGEDPSKILWRWNRFYKACTNQNLPQRSFTVDEFINLFTGACPGSTVVVELGTEEYEGEKRNVVKRYSAPKQEG